jgi:hypothetical protein
MNPSSDLIFRGLRGLRGTQRDLVFHKKMHFFCIMYIVKLLEKTESDVRFGRFGFFGTYWMLGNRLGR